MLGVSVPITGPDAVAGVEDRDAVIVALARWKQANGSQIHGHDIELAVEDDGCTEADVTAEAARRPATRAGVVAVVGPNCSAGAAEARYLPSWLQWLPRIRMEEGSVGGPHEADR